MGKGRAEEGEEDEFTGLSLSQWNPRGWTRIKVASVPPTAHIVALVESHVQEAPKVPGYKVFHKPRPDRRGGGVTLLIRQDLLAKGYLANTCNVKQSSQNGTDPGAIEVLRVRISGPKGTTLTITLFYWPPQDNFDTENAAILFDGIDPKEKHLVLGDANAHHPLWDNELDDKRGEKLENFINNYGPIHRPIVM